MKTKNVYASRNQAKNRQFHFIAENMKIIIMMNDYDILWSTPTPSISVKRKWMKMSSDFKIFSIWLQFYFLTLLYHSNIQDLNRKCFFPSAGGARGLKRRANFKQQQRSSRMERKTTRTARTVLTIILSLMLILTMYDCQHIWRHCWLMLKHSLHK